ncbi:amino acid ABC transporter permease [Glaciimonas sp. PCH181]|uniref:amino acid ABC transporter permease n=1 Tax=Glaciimonas sp. PCH181 TaxID=2133943 RepID=UPI000D39E03F|nr:amino acid ABC transporter permease [Glaciimonas sp. PCH181]PUA18886.1 amino acid ABC transporter permease [Glaciimonas sp. PCH181]
MLHISSAQISYLLTGAVGTLILTLLAFTGGAIGALAIALMRVSRSPALRAFTAGVIQVVQGTPLLILMGLCFYGPNILGIGSVPALAAAAVAMTIYASAFLGEIWRGCIEAVPKAQFEAAECLGLSHLQTMYKVVLPQALRIATPPTVGFMVQIVKNTSVASLVIGYAEMSYAAKELNSSTFEPFLYFGLAAMLYFAMCYPLSLWSKYLERKLNASRR